MMSTYFALAVLGMAVLSAPIVRPRSMLAMMVIASFGLLPVRLVGTIEPHLGIAGHDPRLMTYSIPVILFVIAACMGRVPFRVPATYVALAIYLLIGMTLFWNADGARWAGTMMLFQAIVCSAIGAYLASSSRTDARLATTLIVAILVVISLQSMVGTLQYAGASIFAPDASTAELMGSRVNGTFNHPSALGKAIFLLDVLTLALLPMARGRTKFAAYAAILLSFYPLLLTGSRANLVATMALFAVWVVLLPAKGNLSKKLWLTITLAVAGAASIGVIMNRFQEDPGGGARDYLSTRTVDLMHLVLPSGSGPNSFIEVFGQWDSLIASGWPVHNTPLLLASELGIVGATLILWPLARLCATALIRIPKSPPADVRNAASVTIAMIPGLVLIGATGWGFVHEYTLPLVLLTVGFLIERVSPRINDTSEAAMIPTRHATSRAPMSTPQRT